MHKTSCNLLQYRPETLDYKIKLKSSTPSDTVYHGLLWRAHWSIQRIIWLLNEALMYYALIRCSFVELFMDVTIQNFGMLFGQSRKTLYGSSQTRTFSSLECLKHRWKSALVVCIWYLCLNLCLSLFTPIHEHTSGILVVCTIYIFIAGSQFCEHLGSVQIYVQYRRNVWNIVECNLSEFRTFYMCTAGSFTCQYFCELKLYYSEKLTKF